MSNVVKLEPKKLVWVCIHCNCTTFYLYNDYNVECAGCHTISEGEWRNWLPEDPIEAEDESNSVIVVNLRNSSAALQNILNKLVLNELVLLLAIYKNGKITGWTADFETKEQENWLRKRLTAGKKLLLRK